MIQGSSVKLHLTNFINLRFWGYLPLTTSAINYVDVANKLPLGDSVFPSVDRNDGSVTTLAQCDAGIKRVSSARARNKFAWILAAIIIPRFSIRSAETFDEFSKALLILIYYIESLSNAVRN